MTTARRDGSGNLLTRAWRERTLFLQMMIPRDARRAAIVLRSVQRVLVSSRHSNLDNEDRVELLFVGNKILSRAVFVRSAAILSHVLIAERKRLFSRRNGR